MSHILNFSDTFVTHAACCLDAFVKKRNQNPDDIIAVAEETCSTSQKVVKDDDMNFSETFLAHAACRLDAFLKKRMKKRMKIRKIVWRSQLLVERT